jgi:hypothetical protein
MKLLGVCASRFVYESNIILTMAAEQSERRRTEKASEEKRDTESAKK